MRKPLVALALSALALAGCHAGAIAAEEIAPAAMQAQQATIEQVTVKQVPALLKAHPGAIFLDVRQPEEYVRGHAPGAQLRPLPDLAQWAPTLDKQAKIVVMCRSGSRSMQAAQQLVERGFTNVTNVKGGMLDWERQGLTVEK